MRIGKHIRLTGTVYAALGFLIFGGSVVAYGYTTTQGAFDWATFVRELYSNFGIELISIALTVIVIESLNQRRTERERKEELISQMGSPDNSFAVEAVRILRQKGWLEDGSLQKAYLRDAKLKDADLEFANLQAAYLGGGELQGANLGSVNLKNATLSISDLKATHLVYANLRGAHLSFAQLQEAYMVCSDLQAADLGGVALQGTNLQGANLQCVIDLKPDSFDETTTLPDDSKWTPDTDLTRFTNPNHPDFWRSDDPRSPAYRGKPAD